MDDSDFMDSECSYDSDNSDSAMSSVQSEHGIAFAEEQSERLTAAYAVLTESQVDEEMNHAVSEVAEVLSVPDDDAAAVLRLCTWDINHANQSWFMDNERVRSQLGIMESPASEPPGSHATCSICLDTHPKSRMKSAPCKHYFCELCWTGYVSEAMCNGPSVLNLRCPIPECKARVPYGLLEPLLDTKQKVKYHHYELLSFVETNPYVKWCPSPGCEHAVQCLHNDSITEPMDVQCKCLQTFCFACNEEAHRPVECGMVKAWLLKNTAESENMNWILANTKPCPKCQRPIEKNQGCMHITCSQCKYEFCWLCNGKWQDHGERTGGYYACNRYEAAWKKGEYNEAHKRRENAKNSLERYMHFYERYSAHDRARKKAMEDQALHSEGTAMMERLSGLTKIPTSQLKFISDAWAQVVDCRRILKWTYAYGYYKYDNEDLDEVGRQKEFFEFLQGDAEGALERLHEETEISVKMFVEKKKAVAEFSDFQTRLKGLTVVTRTFFDKFVSQLEQGFDRLEDNFHGENVGKIATTAAAPPTTDPPNLQPPPEMASRWSCHACTFSNDLAHTVCTVCQMPRQSR